MRSACIAAFLAILIHCGGGNDPMSKGQNPSAANPARLSASQISSLLNDARQEYAQLTASKRPGNIVSHMKKGMALAENDPNLNFIQQKNIRVMLSDRFTSTPTFLGIGSESIRERFLDQPVDSEATNSSTLEVFYLLLKYSGAELNGFAEYYVQGVAAEDITGSDVFDTVSNPDNLVRFYLKDGKSLTLRTFGSAGGANAAPSTANQNRNATNSPASSGPGSGARKNYLDFVYSGAALGHFRTANHSFIGYWDGTTLRRADTFYLETNGKEFDGITAKRGGDQFPIESIQIIELRSPNKTPDGVSFDPTPGFFLSVFEAVSGVWRSFGLPEFTLLLLPLLAILGAYLGKKEFVRLENLLKRIVERLTGLDKIVEEGSDKFEGGQYRRALRLILDNDYSDAMPILEQLVAEDDSDTIAVLALLETYLFLGEISRFTMLYNAHKANVDALAKGAVSRYLQIIKAYQNSDYSGMARGIETFKSSVNPAGVQWDLGPLESFLTARPPGLQTNEMLNFLAFLKDHQQRAGKN